MRFDRKKFFDGVKDRLDPTLNQEQVDGFEFLLGQFENDSQWADVRHVAYALATVWHETAYSMQPVEEGYYLGSERRVKAFQKTLRYFPYFGRGYVQLTHKTNYAKAGKAFGVDLVNKPELALQPEIAFKALGGMFLGWYGSKFTAHINANKTDYVNARRCVNILDKAGLIAGYAKSFEKILNSAAANSAQAGSSSTAKTDLQTSDITADPLVPPPPISTEGTSETPPTETVTLKSVGTSLMTKVVAFFAMLTGMGINAGTIVETKLSELTLNHVAMIALGVAVMVLAVFYYRKRQEAADLKDKMLIEKAADPQQNTVEMKRRGWIEWS